MTGPDDPAVATNTSVSALEADIRSGVDTWNDNTRPFVWTKTPKRSSQRSDDLSKDSQERTIDDLGPSRRAGQGERADRAALCARLAARGSGSW